MSVKFYPHNHTYESINTFDKITWTGVTSLISQFKEPFDENQQSLKASLNKKSKWYGLPPLDIQQHWKNENKRSTDLGTWYHNKQEQKLLGLEFTQRYGVTLPIVKSVFEDGYKIAPDQRLQDGLYPEHFVYLQSRGVCGQADEVIVTDGYVHIDDHKSNKDLMKPPYKDWRGVVKSFLPPLGHLAESKLEEYSLQLSTYLYIILRHNPNLKPGKLILNHVEFEEEGRDQFDYPIMKLDDNGEYIMKSERKLEIPYLKNEVELMFKHKK